jgi:hypothetical protein
VDRHSSCVLFVMAGSIDYSKRLRVIGQVLEALEAKAYDIVCYANCYLIRCQTQGKERKLKSFPNFLRLWREDTERKTAAAASGRPPMNVEVIYTSQEIEDLDEQRKARRRDLKGMPSPHSLSNMLRCAGKELSTKKNVRLLLVSNHDHTVVMVYQTANGIRKVEEHPMSVLYDTWVKTYVKRKEFVRAVG